MTAPKRTPPPAPQPERRSWFDLVRTDAGWHVRLTGTNGEIVMTSEVYPDRRDAENVYALCRGAITRTGYLDERSRDVGGKGSVGPVSEGEAGTGPAVAAGVAS